MAKKYYETLGVPESASESDIKKAFRKLSKEYHPDAQAGKSDEEKKKAEERFKDINEAYQVLSDKEKKAMYDMYGTVDGGGTGNSGWGGFDTSDIFRNMRNHFGFDFGGFGETTIRNVGGKVVINAHVTLKDIYNNVNKQFTYNRYEPCPDCNGTGSSDKQVHNCPYCGGTGMITKTSVHGNMMTQSTQPCPHCGGTGKDKNVNPCPHCGGTGSKLVSNTVNVRVDLDWLTNSALQFDGYGNIPSGENPIPGPLVIKPIIDEVDGFSIDRNCNVIKAVDLPIIDCILGTTIKVECLDGKTVNVKIREGAENGEQYRIPNKGFKHNRGTTDMFVVVKYKMPKNLTKEEKKTLENLRKNVNFS